MMPELRKWRGLPKRSATTHWKYDVVLVDNMMQFWDETKGLFQGFFDNHGLGLALEQKIYLGGEPLCLHHSNASFDSAIDETFSDLRSVSS